MNPRSEFRFFDRLRVRWAEVDMQKIVFNGHYLMYFDTAIAGYWRAMALPYQPTMESLQGDLYVRKATLEYEGSARFDDLCDVGIRCGRIGNSSMVLHAALFRGDQRLVHGELVYVFADPATQTSRPVPRALRDVLLAFEAGEPMVQVRLGPWSELGPEARVLRKAVFVDELHWPTALEADDDDAGALQAVARNRLGVALACARLTRGPAEGSARLARFAVLPGLQGSGIGRTLLQALVQAAGERGERELVLQAHLRAMPFYAAAGFMQRGPVYEEAGLLHAEMARAL